MSEVITAPGRVVPVSNGRQEQPTTPLAVLTLARPGLAKGLAKAVLACRPAEKDRRNEFHKYDYASSEAIIEEARQALAGAGLVLLPVEASLVGSERDGADRFELVRTFLLLHESGESAPLRVVWPVVPDKGRPLDKATAAADTLSLAYLLRDLLMMPRVDQADEVNARDDRQHQPEQRKPVPTPKQEPAKPTVDHMETVNSLNRFLMRLEMGQQGEFAADVAKEVGCAVPDLPKADPDKAIRAAHKVARLWFTTDISENMERVNPALTLPALVASVNGMDRKLIKALPNGGNLNVEPIPAEGTFGSIKYAQLETLLVVLRNEEAPPVPE